MDKRIVPLPGDPDRLTLSELCERLGRHRSTVYRYIDDGMPSYQYLGSRVFRWSEVAEWVGASPEAT